jgi:hypothetical protein
MAVHGKFGKCDMTRTTMCKYFDLLDNTTDSATIDGQTYSYKESLGQKSDFKTRDQRSAHSSVDYNTILQSSSSKELTLEDDKK